MSALVCLCLFLIVTPNPKFQEFFKLRTQAIAQLKEAGDNPYPHKFHVSISLTEFLSKFNHLVPEEMLEEEVTVAGNVFHHHDHYY